MKRSGKIVTWLCIYSILLCGCYTSKLNDPRGDEKEQIGSNDIEYVIMKDSTKYVFVGPPEVAKDTLIGVVAKQVSIPMSDVASVGIKDTSTNTAIVIAVASIAVMVVVFVYAGPASRASWGN
jgi:hypothetical protein